jgi:hypothetical protein
MSWLKKYHLYRFPFLVEQAMPKEHDAKSLVDTSITNYVAFSPSPFPASSPSSSSSSSSLSTPPFMHQDMGSISQINLQYPKWAPRDCYPSDGSNSDIDWSSSLLRFQQSGFDEFEIAFSLGGYGEKLPTGVDTSIMQFARKGYSYIHIPFRGLAQKLMELNPAARFLFYIIPDNTPVHMYFDLDGDYSRYIYLRECDESQVILCFLSHLATFFRQSFNRSIDWSRLLLLQSTSLKKFSWHIHIPSEAFYNSSHLKEFVQQFVSYLKIQSLVSKSHPEADNISSPSSSSSSSSSPSLAANDKINIPLCIQGIENKLFCLVDQRVYNGNQNLRCPYNKKPGGMALIPRQVLRLTINQLQLAPRVQYILEEEERMTIEEEVLFHAHPALSLPSNVWPKQYEYLSMSKGEDVSSQPVTVGGFGSRSRHVWKPPAQCQDEVDVQQVCSIASKYIIKYETVPFPSQFAMDASVLSQTSMVISPAMKSMNESEEKGSGMPSIEPGNVLPPVPLDSRINATANVNRPNHYIYTSLASLHNLIGKHAFVYGVVLSVGRPKKTRGSDYVLNITLGDESVPVFPAGISINIFRKDLDSLPLKLIKGDIIRLHRLEITNGALYGTNSIVGGLPEKISAILCIKGGDLDDSCIPYYCSSETYSAIDQSIIRRLRLWAISQSIFHTNIEQVVASPFNIGLNSSSISFPQTDNESKYQRCISQLRDRSFFDLICFIVSIDYSGGTKPELGPIAYVWDGSDLATDIQLQRPQLVRNTFSGSKLFPQCDQPSQFPTVGSILPLSFHESAATCFQQIWEKNCVSVTELYVTMNSSNPMDDIEMKDQELTSAFSVGSVLHNNESCLMRRFPVVRLRNIVLEYDPLGHMYLKFHQKSRIIPLHISDPKIVRILQKYSMPY